MKVFHFASYYYSNDLYRQLFAVLREFGVEQGIISTRGFNAQTTNDTSIKYYGKPVLDALDKVWLGRKKRKYIRLFQELVEEDALDVIHAHTLFSDGFAACQIARQYSVKLVVTVRNTDVFVFGRPVFCYAHSEARAVLEFADTIIFTNHQYQRIFENRLGVSIPPSKVRVIPNGIDSFWLESAKQETANQQVISTAATGGADEYLEAQSDTASIELITLATVNRNKNIGVVVSAVEYLNRSDPANSYRLTVVGSCESRFAKRFVTSHSSDVVRFLGRQEKRVCRQLMRQSDIFILLSKTEGFGIVYVEALSQGLPIVYSRGQGLDGWIDADAPFALACEHDSVPELVGHIKCLMGTKKLADKSSMVEIANCFEWMKVGEQYKDVYDEMIRSTS